MATRTISDVGGNWNALTTWVEGAVPTAADDVVATPTSGNLTINGAANCKTADFTNYTGILTHSTSNYWTISGSLKFVPGMTFTNGTTNAQVLINGTGNLTCAGKAFASLSFSGFTTVTLLDDLYIAGYFVTSSGPTLIHNNHTVYYTGAQTTMIIYVQSANVKFYDLVVQGASTWLATLAISANFEVTHSFTINGASATQRLIVQSNTIGQQRTITTTGATMTGSYLDFRDVRFFTVQDLSTITGGSGDCGGNDNITFTPAVPTTWTNTNGGNWSDAGNWSGGRTPLPQDDVSMACAFGSGKTVIPDMPRLGRDISWLGATGTPSWTANARANTSYGSLTMIAGMNWTCWYGYTFEGRGAHVLTTMEKSFASNVTISSVGGSYTLGSNLSIPSGILFHLGGAFDAATYNVTTNSLQSSGTRARTLQLGSGVWTLNGSSYYALSLVATGLTFDGGTATVRLAYTGATDQHIGLIGQTLAALEITGGGSGAVIFDTSASIGLLTVNAPKRLSYVNGITQTITSDLIVQGYVRGTVLVEDATGNGNLDSWTNPTTPVGWSVVKQGTSSVNQETGDVRTPGGSALRFAVDPSGSDVYTTRGGMTIGKRYKLTLYAKVSSAVGNPTMIVWYGTSNYSPALTTSYTRYVWYFTASNTFLSLERGNNCAGKSIYIDDVTLEECSEIEMRSTEAGSPFTLSKASGAVLVDHVVLQDSTAQGGATWFAGWNSLNVSGNSGWLFQAPIVPVVSGVFNGSQFGGMV